VALNSRIGVMGIEIDEAKELAHEVAERRETMFLDRSGAPQEEALVWLRKAADKGMLRAVQGSG
jgi:hypothetical protein